MTLNTALILIKWTCIHECQDPDPVLGNVMLTHFGTATIAMTSVNIYPGESKEWQ